MKVQFDNSLRKYFSAKVGAYSEVTQREYFDSQMTLTGIEADIVIEYFGYDNLQAGKVKDDKNKASKVFYIYPFMEKVNLNLVYPKSNKPELRLYLSKSFKPEAGEMFFIFLNVKNQLVIGSLPIDVWTRIKGETNTYNETMDFEDENIDENISLMDNPFDPTKINIETKTPSLDTIIKRIERNNIQMDTSTYFQRQGDLWDKTKQSRLIESILIRFPLPAFYFDSTDDDKWLVVDGLQRLSSIRNFCVDKTLKLTNLEFLTQLNEKSWEDLSTDLQRVIEETQIVLYKIMPGTPTDVKFNIFKRINTGGLGLAPQEIRHALFQGKPALFISRLASSKEFIEATSGKIPTYRMVDRDFINRFLSFYLLDYKNYQPDLDTFMSKAMAVLQNKTQEECDIIENNFKEAMKLSMLIFGKNAFRKTTLSSRSSPINKALFDSISTQFALLDSEKRSTLKNNKDEFLKQFTILLNEDSYFISTITSSTGDKKRISYRHSRIEDIINKISSKND